MFSAAKNFSVCYTRGVQVRAHSSWQQGSGFDELFPGLRVAVQTLSINFKIRYFGKIA